MKSEFWEKWCEHELFISKNEKYKKKKTKNELIWKNMNLPSIGFRGLINKLPTNQVGVFERSFMTCLRVSIWLSLN